MRTLVLLLACLTCCVTAGHLHLGQKQTFPSQRQQFLLDVLLQLQKPLVNTELIQMGEVLVTEPNMYTEPNDVILQEFLQLASNQRILGRNDVYNPVDMTTLRQLVGLQRFFVRARDFQVFQKNVIYARLYCNAVMFVDALTLALRERLDTQDLIKPAMNEILPELYYDNYVLYSAINVNFDELVNQVARKTTNTGILGFFGGLVPGAKYMKPWMQRRMQSAGDSSRDQFGLGNQVIPAKVVVPVEQQDGLSSELANDIQLDVAWRNILIDQLAQTAFEGIYQQAQESQYQQGVYSGIKPQQYGGYSKYMNPFYGIQNQYGYGKQGYVTYGTYGPYVESDAARYVYERPEYTGAYGPQQYKEYQKAEYDPYGSQKYQGARYGSQTLKDQEYGASYTGIYGGGARYGYQAPYQHQQAYEPYGREDVVNIRGMPMSNEDDMIVLNRRARHVHDQQKAEKDNGSDERKHDSKRKDEQYDNDVRSSGEIAQYITLAEKLSYERRGEILLQSIQELAARFNIERIVEAAEGNTYKQQQYYEVERANILQLMQLMRKLIEQVREERSISKNSEVTVSIIADIINGRLILKQQLHSSAVQSTLLALQQQIANILGYQAGAVTELIPLALFYGNLRERLTQQIIISYAELISDYRRQLQPYTKEQVIADIAVQNVQITPLITYTEYYDADLINLLDEQLLQSQTNNLQRLSQKVVARQQRLNYEPFTISLDIAVAQPQEVVVRVLLLPKIDNNGRLISLTEYPQNYIVIDTFVQKLQSGKNLIQRSSRQFNGYNNDVTTMSQLYRQIMSGKNPQQQSCSIRQLPRNLLLPRGTNVNGDGLPVQILVIATPLTEQNRQYLSGTLYPQEISGFGIAAVGADQLPLGYPLDRHVFDMETLNVPNVQVIATEIQYDNSIHG